MKKEENNDLKGTCYREHVTFRNQYKDESLKDYLIAQMKFVARKAKIESTKEYKRLLNP